MGCHRAAQRDDPLESRPSQTGKVDEDREVSFWDTTPGRRAAINVAVQLGLKVDEPLLIQETNHTVVWLRPFPILAKVGTRRDSAEALIREHHVASALALRGAPIARPVPGTGAMRDSETGLVVTLWSRLDHDSNAKADGAMVGQSLVRFHAALAECDVALPTFRDGLERTRTALFDDLLMAALAPADRTFLRAAFTGLMSRLDAYSFPEQRLHGEPHAGNYLLTPLGLRWIDFEDACIGPVEWDLAFLPADGVAMFTDVDLDLLALLQPLISARVATWCWVQARFPDMRRHGEHHLGLVRSAWPKAN
jgi:Ser/Thr protein kinase RdoA (MazF antagonist)